MIRYASREDLEFLTTYDQHISREELENSVKSGKVLLLLEEGSLAGWLRFQLFWDSIPFINLLYFLEGYRGRGLGTQLLSHWEKAMWLQGYSTVLTSTLSNERGQFFYRKNGYLDCGALLLPGEPLEIFFRKTLLEP